MTGCNLRDADARFRELGGSVRNINRTGENAYWHPSLMRQIVVNSRRKDAPRALTTAIRRLETGR